MCCLPALKFQSSLLSYTATGQRGKMARQDLKRAITSLAPPGIEYEHEEAWHDGNGHSHVQAALLGPSIVLAVRNGSLKTGTWQQVVAINHDNHPRTRTIEVTITGLAG